MFGIVHEEIEAYALEHTTPLPPTLEELRRDTVANADAPSMLSDQLVGTLLQCLIHASGAKRVLELGTFTGFSALMMAHALPDDGKLITCDINPRPAIISARHPTAGRSRYGSGRPSRPSRPSTAPSIWFSSTPIRPTTPTTMRDAWSFSLPVGSSL